MLSPAMDSFLAKMFRLIVFLYASTCWNSMMVHTANAWPSQLIIKEDSKFNPGLKKLMIGSDTFFNFLEDTTVIIDKSLFIKRIVEDPHKAILITYPPKFGKSTNLRMLKAFLMMEQIGGGLEIDPTQTHAYYYFVNGMTSGTYGMQRYSKLPLISQHKDIINEYLGRRMVIEFSWLGAQTMDRKHYGFMQTLEPKLVELFNDHFYLSAALDLTMRNNNTNETYKKQCEENYDRYEKYVLEKELGNETEISESFQWLSKIMYEAYGKKVFILMDDFVRIFDHMIQSDITDVNEWQKILNFMKNFLKNTINNNPYVEKVICTGFIPASVKEMFDGIDNFVHYSALDGDLQDFYGFSKSEVNSLMDYFAIPPPLAKKAHEFYEGYTTKPNSNVSIYNGYSTARFLNSRNITHYWREWVTSIDDLEHWFKIDKFRNIVQSLIKGETLEIEYQSLSKEHQPILYPRKPVVWGKDVKADERSINTIFTLLFDIGYFTLANNVRIDEQKISQRKIIIRIPNQEMKEILQHKLDNPETPEVS